MVHPTVTFPEWPGVPTMNGFTLQPLKDGIMMIMDMVKMLGQFVSKTSLQRPKEDPTQVLHISFGAEAIWGNQMGDPRNLQGPGNPLRW